MRTLPDLPEEMGSDVFCISDGLVEDV